tara:strand:- start:87 stop:305 length:219 start_codon:yes stop_codon:yes gene_type:complete
MKNIVGIMKGRDYSDFSYWRETFIGVRFFFVFFKLDVATVIQKLFGKNRLEKDTLRKLEVLFKNETKIIFNV